MSISFMKNLRSCGPFAPKMSLSRENLFVLEGPKGDIAMSINLL